MFFQKKFLLKVYFKRNVNQQAKGDFFFRGKWIFMIVFLLNDK